MILVSLLIFLGLIIGFAIGRGSAPNPICSMESKTSIQVKLKSLSNDRQEIERFLLDYVAYGKLDQPSINLLLTRIEELKADETIFHIEDDLKRKIDGMSIKKRIEEIEETEEEKPVKRGRKRK